MKHDYEAALVAIDLVSQGHPAYCKFLSPNDTGKTGSHQSGILVGRKAMVMVFGPGFSADREHEPVWVSVAWHDWETVEGRFKYYVSKHECHLTNCFSWLEPQDTGSLLVLVSMDEKDYRGFLLSEEAAIDLFMASLNMSQTARDALFNAPGPLPPQPESGHDAERAWLERFIAGLGMEPDFPDTEAMACHAREWEEAVHDHAELIVQNPDRKLLAWTDSELALFEAIERARYGPAVSRGFPDMKQFLDTANQILNRRKSRAGKSLEHHLDAIFRGNGLSFEAQAVTEGRKRPDFIFPSGAAYHDAAFPAEKLITLAAKTTCKDRWRQILNEADRLKDRDKFLFTLQRGISDAQLQEMSAEHVRLVVPAPYISDYPAGAREGILTLRNFVQLVQSTQHHL